jgi:probable addiction module antidote protein
MTTFAPFDAADYLDDEETIAEYLTAALENPDPDVFLAAVRNVARARGMTQLAKDAGLGRESLYKALTPGAKPRYDTVLKLLQVLGIKLTASPSSTQPPLS